MEFFNDVIGVITAPGWRHFIGALCVRLVVCLLLSLRLVFCASLISTPAFTRPV